MLGTILSLLALIWFFVMYGFGFLGLYVALSRYRGRQVPSRFANLPTSQVPGVTILRPLRGIDCNLAINLEASFLQDHPKIEIIFTVANEGDASIQVVESLIKKYPEIDAKLIIGEEIVGVNPKINNLIRSYRIAKYDIIWIIDSNVLTSTGTCARSAQILHDPPPKGQRQIGLIHHLPFAILPDNALGSRVEQVFLCGIHAKMYLAINYLAISSCVAGKSNLFRKSDLERAAEKRRRTAKGLLLAEGEGGLAAFGKYLGEDNMMAESIWNDLGMRHAMGSDLAANPVGTMSFNSFFRRRVRWIRVRKYMVVSSTLIEPLTECFLTAIIGAHALQRFFAISFFFTLSFHIIFSFVLDCILFHTLTLSSPSTNRSNLPQHDGPGLAFLRAWLVRESMALPIWTFAMLGNTISWRDEGEKYTVLMDGSVQRLTGDDGLVDRILRWTTKLSYRRQKYEQLERKDEHAVS